LAQAGQEVWLEDDKDPSVPLAAGMDGWKGGGPAAGWHCSTKTAWMAPERDSLTADCDSLGMLSQDLLLASQSASYFQLFPQMRNPTQLWLPKTLMQAEASEG